MSMIIDLKYVIFSILAIKFIWEVLIGISKHSKFKTLLLSMVYGLDFLWKCFFLCVCFVFVFCVL